MRPVAKFCVISAMSKQPSRLCAASLLALMMAWPAFAGRDIDQDEALRLVEQGELLPLQQILDDALGRYPGRLLEVELEFEDGRYIYEIELVTQDKRVIELEYDGQTGRLLEIDEED